MPHYKREMYEHAIQEKQEITTTQVSDDLRTAVSILAYLRARAGPVQAAEIQNAMLQLVNVHGSYITSLSRSDK